MKYLSRRILFLTAFYICIIFGIFALQFTNGNAFSLSIGSMMVSGTTETDDSGKTVPVLPLHIGSNGLDFFLDSQNSLMAYTSEKTAAALKVISIKEEDTRFTVFFTDGVSVAFSSEKRGDVDILSVRANMSAKYQKVVFPYKTTRSARIEKKDSLTLVTTGKKQFVFSGAAVSQTTASGVRGLSLLRASPLVYYQTYIPAKGLVIEDLPGLPGSSAAAYAKAVELYAANALVSLKEAVAAGALSEPVVAAYIAEMGRIGMYRAAVESIPETWRNGPSRNYLTATFLNNLERTYASLVSKERQDRLELSRKLTENNPASFEFPSLIPYLVDRGSSVLITDVERVASSIDAAAITPLQAAGILEAMMDYPQYLPAQTNTLASLADACERKLKASLVRINDNLYASADGKSLDTLETLRIAPVLIRYGSSSGDKGAWKAAGHLLVTSLVAFAGDQSVLPAGFTLAGGEGAGEKTGIVARSEQTLSPAVVYPALVAGNSWYPHALSLAEQAGPGVWAWTSAESVKITRQSENVMKITTRFPQGETHYMVLRGIKPFYRISIYGLDFRTDPRFESYNSSGYVYNEQTGTLYLKMRHKAEYEEVIIYSGAAPVSAGTAPAAGGSAAGGAEGAAAVLTGESVAGTETAGQ